MASERITGIFISDVESKPVQVRYDAVTILSVGTQVKLESECKNVIPKSLPYPLTSVYFTEDITLHTQ